MRLVPAIALRELRGGLRDFRLFLACLVVGVTVIAAVGLLAARVQGGIHHEARTLLGGDVEMAIVNAPATDPERAFLQSQGRLSLTLGMRAMATFGNESTLVELKAVDEAYPLLGTVELASHKPLSEALGGNRIVIGEELRARLGVKEGDRITLGDSVFTISDAIVKEPDRIAGAFSLGPRVLVRTQDLRKAGLLEPGSLIHYNYHVLLSSPAGLSAFTQTLARKFPSAPWIVKTYNENNRTVQALVERLQLFLTLAGLSSLLIGGVGILNAAESYVSSKSSTIATFKALGATRNTVFAVYMTVLGIMTVLGLLISMLAGLALSWLLMPYLAQFLPLASEPSGDASALLLAAAFGALTVFTFSIAPLARGVEVKPTVLFRGLGMPGATQLTRGKLIVNLLLASSLVILVIATAGDRAIATGFIAIALVCFAVFTLAARLLAVAARHVQLPPGILRLGIAQLHRPGAPLFSILLSIGIGLSVLVALLVVEGNVERDIRESIPAQAPSLFLIDIQPAQKDALLALLASKPFVSEVASEPMVRGRIAKLRGVPVEQAHISDNVKWATESDRGFSYGDAMPPGTRITSGAWWPPGYRGKPLASLDGALAKGMGLGIGDSITLNILGQDIDATIANLRDVNYMSLRINFALILSPGAVERFPMSAIATLHVNGQGNETALVHEIASRFSNISAIQIRESLAQLQEIVGHISTAVRITALFTILSGVMVLISALASALDQRAYDTVIFKVLGARRRDILAVFFIEWMVIACVTGLLSCLFGMTGGWLILSRLGWIEFHFLPGVVAGAMLLTLAFIAAAGFLMHSRAFALKANVILRNE